MNQTFQECRLGEIFKNNAAVQFKPGILTPPEQWRRVKVKMWGMKYLIWFMISICRSRSLIPMCTCIPKIRRRFATICMESSNPQCPSLLVTSWSSHLEKGCVPAATILQLFFSAMSETIFLKRQISFLVSPMFLHTLLPTSIWDCRNSGLTWSRNRTAPVQEILKQKRSAHGIRCQRFDILLQYQIVSSSKLCMVSPPWFEWMD